MPHTNLTPQLRRVSAHEGPQAILEVLRADGGVIITDFLTIAQVNCVNEEVRHEMHELLPGSRLPDQWFKDFHGHNTKRLCNLVTHSKTFREAVLENDLVHSLCEDIFTKDAGTYWMSTAQIIEIGPGSEAQALHRDQLNYPVFADGKADWPEAVVNFLIALTEFNEQTGATRVIPGSHKWADLSETGTPEDTVPASMDPGSACLISGKVVHGGGANLTKDCKRAAITLAFQPSYLTQEEAFPFLVSTELARTLSPRAHRMLGFRCQFPRDCPGIWKIDYSETDETFHQCPT